MSVAVFLFVACFRANPDKVVEQLALVRAEADYLPLWVVADGVKEGVLELVLKKKLCVVLELRENLRHAVNVVVGHQRHVFLAEAARSILGICGFHFVILIFAVSGRVLDCKRVIYLLLETVQLYN